MEDATSQNRDRGNVFARLARGAGQDGMRYQPARDLKQVIEAWRLVYAAYRRIGIIPPNPFSLHTAPSVTAADSAVIVGDIRGLTCSTLTAMIDRPDQPPTLPLDRVYSQELAKLRQGGKRLMEVGLFADRRTQLSRTAESLFELMRYAYYFGASRKVSDFVIGVHPRHAAFYVRAFGFEIWADPKTYPAVNNNPVVLLYGDLNEYLEQGKSKPAMNFFLERPMDHTAFQNITPLNADALKGTEIAAFLEHQAQQNRFSEAS